jgi:CDP-diacylglycerol--serine O-phosphatidyltransferase
MVASLVLVIVSLEVSTFDSRSLALLIPPFMLAIAYLMVSNIKYPSFKDLDWQTQTKLRNFIGLILGFCTAFFFKEFFFALLFFAYIVYGPIRHVVKNYKLNKKTEN